MIAALKSDKGNRDTNQDYLTYTNNGKNQSIYILCDGMGGYKGGEVASFECANFLKEEFERTTFKDVDQVKEWLHKIILIINNRIRSMGKQNLELEKMGTTLICLIIGEDFRVFANVGDSRIYIYNKKEITQLSDDQTFANALLKAGYISAKEAAIHPKKGILISAIGSSDEDLDIQIEEIKQKGSYLLCSDGLYNVLNNKQILDVLNSNERIDVRANTLINLVNIGGGKDNVSVILVEDLL